MKILSFPLIIMAILLSAILAPTATMASEEITITAQGSDNTTPSSVLLPPSDLAVTHDGTNVILTWTNAVGSTGTLIMGKVGSYPTAIDDGDEVYQGANETFSYPLDLSTLDGNMYYSAWSYNGTGYSIIYATTVLGIGGVMTNAIIFVGLTILGLGILTLGIVQSKPWLNLISGIVWLALAVWGFTSYEALYDLNFIIGCVGIFLLVVCLFQPILSLLAKSGDQTAAAEAMEKRWESKESKWLTRTAVPESWRKRRNQE